FSGPSLCRGRGGAALDDRPQLPPAFAEDLRWHERQVRGHDRSEIHLAQHVTLQVNARGDLDQGHMPVAELEYGPLGDVEHGLSRAGRVRAAADDPLELPSEILL